MPERVIRSPALARPRVENDVWQTLGLDASQPVAEIPAGPVIVPLAVWKERRDELAARHDPLGVWLKPDDEPAEVAPDLERFALVAIHFPKLGDGRGYSSAALLRTRHGYRGELRAFGDIGRDQLLALARCGFDSFRLGDRHDPENALAAVDELKIRYQGAVDDAVPLFRRRAAAGNAP
jgi:uncharacterized protein (DUF934 family)